MSYLAWPASINGKIQSPDGKPFHMTLKYLGGVNISTAEIATLTRGLDKTPVNFHDSPRWADTIFEFRGVKHNVLELLNPPDRLFKLRECFDGMRTDDFPVFRPHIAIPQFWADFIRELGPGHVVLELAPLALMGLK